MRSRKPGSVRRFDWVPPGPYEVCRQKRKGDKGYEWMDVGERTSVSVRPGSVERVHLSF